MKTVTAADANRQFSTVLRRASAGETITITSRGKPVATIGPIRSNATPRAAFRHTLLKRLRSQPTGARRNWKREDLYER